MLVVALRVCKMCKADPKLPVQLVLARFYLLDMHVSNALYLHDIAIVCHMKKLALLLINLRFSSIFKNEMSYGVIDAMPSERHDKYTENHLRRVTSYIIPNTIYHLF